MTTEAKPRSERDACWKIGDAAERAGLSVRALHHYEAAGLVAPARTSLGHRRYSEQDINGLRRIAQLRRLGLSLEAIRACLAGEQLTPRRVLELRLDALREQLAELQQAADQLENVLVAEASSAGVLDLWTAVDVMASLEQRLEPESFAAWMRARRASGPDVVAGRERRFRELVEQLRAELQRGTDPSQEPVSSLARRWEALAEEVYGDDAALRCGVAAAVSQVPGLIERYGCDRAVLSYVGRGLAALCSPDAASPSP